MPEPLPAAVEGPSVRQSWPREALAIMSIVAARLDADPEIVIYQGGMDFPGPWLCFDCAGRKFGIWLRTLKLYEADELGAMGEDPIDLAGLG